MRAESLNIVENVVVELSLLQGEFLEKSIQADLEAGQREYSEVVRRYEAFEKKRPEHFRKFVSSEFQKSVREWQEFFRVTGAILEAVRQGILKTKNPARDGASFPKLEKIGARET